MVSLDVRALGDDDRPWIDEVTRELWDLPVVTPAGVYPRPAARRGCG